MNQTKEFFDALAPKWDEGQEAKEGFILSLLRQIGIQKGDRVLDLACGTGVITEHLHDLSGEDVLGLDLSSKMIEIAKKKYEGKGWAHFEEGDFLSWGKEERFDVIVLYNAYPHFLDPKRLSACLAKHLKDGGKFAIVHSLGRKKLDEHHANIPGNISRSLLPPKEEASFFRGDFDVFLQKEGEDFYLLAGATSKAE